MSATSTLPRPAGHVISVVRRLANDPLTALPELRDEVGDIYLVDVPWLRTVVLTHPRDLHTVLVRDAKNYRKDTFTRQLADILGDGLLLSEGEVWKRNRRLAQPAFHAQALRSYATAMVELTDETTAGWGARRQLDLHAEMMRLTLRIVARTLFGHDIGSDAEAVGHALDAFMRTSLGVLKTGWRLPTWVPTPMNLRHLAALREVDRVVYRMIDEHRRGAQDQSTLLGMLLAATDEDGGLTDKQLRDEAVTLLMAGHETTAVALTHALYLLSQHPSAEERLHAELDEVLEDRAPTLEDTRRLAWARAVVFETMRLYPPAWSIGRETLIDARIGDHVVPKGVHVWMAQWVVHRDPRWYADPLEFRPERWLDGTLEKSLPDCAWLPFGAGSRACIGKRFAEMEAVLVLASVARRHALRLAPGETLELTPSITLRPEGGLSMIASRRVRRARAAA
jgi:cytochrome P450